MHEWRIMRPLAADKFIWYTRPGTFCTTYTQPKRATIIRAGRGGRVKYSQMPHIRRPGTCGKKDRWQATHHYPVLCIYGAAWIRFFRHGKKVFVCIRLALPSCCPLPLPPPPQTLISGQTAPGVHSVAPSLDWQGLLFFFNAQCKISQRPSFRKIRIQSLRDVQWRYCFKFSNFLTVDLY